MEISFVLEWPSFWIGFGVGLVTFFVAGMVLAYRQNKKDGFVPPEKAVKKK